MAAYARLLFNTAAAFNLAIAFALSCLRPQLGQHLGLEPAHGSHLLFLNITCVFIALFAYAYWRAAQDSVTYRPYIVLGLVGKVLVVIVAAGTWWLADIDARLTAMAAADLLFCALFLDFLRRTAPARPTR